ncbi:PD40 domain-containing protein [bacterium]|nr:PD40 domain-containing protein [bacterium]
MRKLRYIAFLMTFCFVLCTQKADAQYHQNFFGTNKVHYTDFKWKILETKHFEIYYYPEMQELAERAAGLAEEQYLELETRLNHSLIKRVPMIIFSSHLYFQQTNTTPYELPEGVGGFFEFFKGRVVLPSDGSTTNFRRVIRHELAHVMMTSKVNRILSQHRKFNHPGLPLWFTEGLAEFWSGEPDFQAEMVMRDATINNTVVPLQYFYRVEGTYYMYKLGENLLHFVKERYGDEKVLLLMENCWKYDQFEKTVELTLGKKYEELNREWIYWLRKKYYPTVANNDVPSAISTVNTREGFNSKPAYFFKDDKEYLFYLANRNGYTNIYKQELKTNKSEIVIKGERSSAFEAFHFFKSKIDVNKKGELAFVSKSGESDVLYIYDNDTKKITHKYMYKNLIGLASPSWSPDGKSIVFSGLSVSGNDDLYIIRVTGDENDGMIEQLNNDFYDDRNPAWSPDGKYIVYSSDRTHYGEAGAYNLFLYDRAKRQTYYLTSGNYMDDSPSWSPAGDMIAFTSNRRGTPTNVWILPFRIGESDFVSDLKKSPETLEDKYSPRPLTAITSAVFDPVWTNSGDLIFSAFEEFSFKIRTLPDAYAKAQALQPGERIKSVVVRSSWITPTKAVTQANTKPYQKRYGLDFVQGAFQADPIYGSGGGAQIGVTDMLGNDQYYFVVYNNARSTEQILYDWNFVITKINLNQRANFAYGLFRFKGEFFEIDDFGGISPVDENRYGGFFQLLYPLSKFERIETSLNISRFKRDATFGTLLPIDGVLVSNTAGYVFDNTLWGPTGPLDGNAVSLSVGYTTDVKRSQQNYSTVIFDVRNYARITNRSAFASRAMVQWNQGKNPQNYLLGGSWDLRGYPRWSLPGTRFFVVNNELRFPFVDDLNLRLPFGGFGFRSIRGALFMDMGNAWGSQFNDGRVILGNQKFDGIIGSLGTGFRINFFGVLVLRFDYGKMFDLRGYRIFGQKLPGNRSRPIVTNFNETRDNEQFGGRNFETGEILKNPRWSRGIFWQIWFGYDY